MNAIVLPVSFLAGSYGGFFCFDGIRKTYEYFKCQYAEGATETILAYQGARSSGARNVPIKIVQIDAPLDTAAISGSSLALGGACGLSSLMLSSLILKTAFAGASAMLLVAATGYLFYHSFSSRFLKEAAVLTSLEQEKSIDSLPKRQCPVRLYLHNAPFFTDQPVHCPGTEPADHLPLPFID